MKRKGGEGVEASRAGPLLDRSIHWLVVIIASVLFSLLSVLRQREALGLSLAGQPQAAASVGDVLPLRRLAAVLVSAALTFFFLLSLQAEADALEGGQSAAIRSAGLNRWAALFVLAAAVLRLVDVFEQEET